MVDYFLGHAAAWIADKHYASLWRGRVADMVGWLGDQYGVK